MLAETSLIMSDCATVTVVPLIVNVAEDCEKLGFDLVPRTVAQLNVHASEPTSTQTPDAFL